MREEQRVIKQQDILFYARKVMGEIWLGEVMKYGFRKCTLEDFDFLFKHNKQFKSIVNKRDFSKYKEKIQIPESVYA